MTAPGTKRSAALEPVRDALLRAARKDAETVLAEARRAAAAVLDEARARATAILDEARRQGTADGLADGAALRVRARRTVRARELAAQRAAYDDLREQATQGVRRLRAESEYPCVRDELVAQARRLLGDDISVTEHPDGGVVATAPGRRVDLTLDALAGRALERLGSEVEVLWAP
ncbi:hypothetical protein ACFOSC_10450 [Streptantibioticus rubrisoli]|uniref:V-type proton ATPase subunit E n=1 Tax=Streptantibioticus rubrisoli TaxID=1387313 RepID=A0ABT1PBH9_9ACTN|nr:hypothetical protein [Streptantibioticus rubrisoli]MCQ4042732.1 hypothetical protein [Streptantibioticus rubrisoli]